MITDPLQPAIRAWRPPIAPPRSYEAHCCPDCGSVAWSRSPAEKRHHERVHAGEARLREFYPGVLTTYDAREAIKLAGPPDWAPAEAWVSYALDVLWALFSRSVCERRLGRSGILLKLKTPHKSWPQFAQASLADFIAARREGRPCDARLRRAAAKAPPLFDPSAPNAVRRILESAALRDS
jgi:hypothetical protein